MGQNATYTKHDGGIADELDRSFDVLSHACRRIVVEELERAGPSGVSHLAARVADRTESLSESDATVALVHNHLPRMEDADVVAFDPLARKVELDEAGTVRAVLAAGRRHVGAGPPASE